MGGHARHPSDTCNGQDRPDYNLVKFICFSAVIEQFYIIPTQAHLGIGIGPLPDPDPVVGSVGAGPLPDPVVGPVGPDPDPVPVGSSEYVYK